MLLPEDLQLIVIEAQSGAGLLINEWCFNQFWGVVSSELGARETT